MRRKISFRLVALIFFFLMAVNAVGQTLAQPSSATVPEKLSIVESMKKTVVFLQTDCLELDGQGRQVTRSYFGTAFLLGVADPRWELYT